MPQRRGRQQLPMKKTNKLVYKVKRLLKRLGCPRWLHHFGPKTYELYEHLCALLVRYYCKLSFRRVKQLLDLLGLRCPSKSALQYTSAKLEEDFWHKVLRVTSPNPYIVALDSTGLSTTNPSYHYLRRIDGKLPKKYVKLSVAFDTRHKKFCAAKVRILPRHDLKDAKHLLKQSLPKIAVADKGYVSENLYEFAHEQGILLMIPKKKNARKGFYRKKMHKKFCLRTYHRRELVEAGFGSVKRKFGGSVSSRKARTIRTEVYGRLACHNIFSYIIRLLGQSLFTSGVFYKLFSCFVLEE